MHITKRKFLILLAFFLCDSCLISSYNFDDEQDLPHQQQIAIADTGDFKVHQAETLYKKVILDKDFASAQTLINLGASNKCVADYLKAQRNASNKLKKVIELGKQIEQESSLIDLSISKVLDIMNKSQDQKVIKASKWLRDSLPGNRIQLFVVELLSFDHNNSTQEVKNILNILSATNFGYQQIQKAKSKLIP